ncbi:MAG: UDP-3-O-(3-hydroxymyristoyl)glucosamine N-acyltransferase [Pseudomonadota bacterium]|nr:UDP-3-O-(3-hydroxymyristoyl)glucosamine N-acyltransferase [Pseudomonadota bacterium]
MADPRFYSVAGPFNLKSIADISNASIGKGVDDQEFFYDVQTLSSAKKKHISFLDNKRYIDQFSRTSAGACLVHPDFINKAPDDISLLISDEPYRGYALVAAAFYPTLNMLNYQIGPKPIDDTAEIGENCKIASSAIISKKARIGNGCQIGANTVLGPGIILGKDCRIGANVTISYSIIGDRVCISSGTQIGQDGFGFAPGKDNHMKVPQLGRVIIGDDVDIGSNTSIDRGSGPDTVIGEGTKIDNLVQIAHNVKLGKYCFVVSQVGISGSTEIGDYAVLGGQAGIAGHLHIGDGARIGAKSGVMGDLKAGITVGGFPARPLKEWLRGIAMLRRIAIRKDK